MNRIQRQRLIGLAALTAIAASVALPALAQDSYPYAGLSVGRSRTNIDDSGLAEALAGTGLTATALTRDEKDTAYRLFGGLQFNRYWGVELGYFDLGKSGFELSTVPAGRVAGRIGTHGYSLDLVGTLPLSENWSALGRIGANYARARGDFSGSGVFASSIPSTSKRETNGKLGLGLQYALSQAVLVRGEVERYRTSDSVGGRNNINVASVSLVFPFGREARPMPRVAAAPVYVAPPAPVAVVPAPVVEAPPPPMMAPAPPPPIASAPMRSRVSFTAESLFGFDQSVVRPEGEAALDKFTRDMADLSFDTMVVEGYTDRLGSTAYNQTLSMQRAEAVKAYLVDTGRVRADKISAVGKGESDPVTQAGACKGERPTAQLIICLQPDRRVEVEVTGMR